MNRIVKIIIVASIVGVLLTLATYSYQTSFVGFASGHPAAIYHYYGFPLSFYNDTSLDASFVSYQQVDVLHGVADFLLFFALSGVVLAVAFVVYGRTKDGKPQFLEPGQTESRASRCDLTRRRTDEILPKAEI